MRFLSFLCLLGTADALEVVQFGAFVHTATYSIAKQLGFFEANNVHVQYNQVPSSIVAFENILNGTYDVLMAAVDNALNYRFNKKDNVTVLGQQDQGPDLVLASIPSITSFQQLKGKPIIVDSPTSGFAYLLRDVLEGNGLSMERGDYTFMAVGGTNTRYAALKRGTLDNGTAVYATILNYPVTALAQTLPPGQTLNILARVSDTVSPITSDVFTTHESILHNRQKRQPLTKFIASMYAANHFLLDPLNKACVTKALAVDLNVSSTLADQQYMAAVDKTTGEVSPQGNSFLISHQGIMNDVKVRQKFDGFTGVPADFDFEKALKPGPGKLIDYSIRNEAVQQASKSVAFKKLRNKLAANCRLQI